MSVWGGLVLPRLIDLVMRNKAASAERARLVPVAAGVVLEVGIVSENLMSRFQNVGGQKTP